MMTAPILTIPRYARKKSGGETQTPFYVTVAASFVQLYSNNIGGEAAGLVLFLMRRSTTWMMRELAAYWNSFAACHAADHRGSAG